MVRSRRWARVLVIAGAVGLIAGAVDPLEGSVVILGGVGLAALGARLGHSRQVRLLSWALVLVAAGVGAMFALSAGGGIGGSTGRSLWWAVLMVPYPIGWILGLVGAFRAIRERAGRDA